MMGDDKDEVLSDQIDVLSHQILKAFVISGFDKTDRRFIPDGVIDKLIDKEFVTRVFGHEPSTKPLIDFISVEAKKCFAIAVMISIPATCLQDAMYQLQSAGISDDSLPINDSDIMWNKINSMVSYRNIGHPRNEGNAGTPLTEDRKSPAKVWSPLRTTEFYTRQWSFLAQVFCRSRFTHDLKKQSILPFGEKLFQCNAGAFGIVSKFQIHHSHLIDTEDSVSRFVPTLLG